MSSLSPSFGFAVGANTGGGGGQRLKAESPRPQIRFPRDRIKRSLYADKPRESGMEVERINPNLGARITGADIAQFTLADREVLHELLDEHLVLFFTGQELDPRQILSFAEVFGEIQPPEEAAPFTPTLEGDLNRLHYVDVTGTTRGTYSDIWHSDVSFFEAPTHGAVLQPETLPSLGGDTLWASMYAAYDALDASMKVLIEDLRAVHEAAMPGNFTANSHPIVRVNPRTGRRGLFVNRLFTKRIEGLPPVESANLLEMLLAHCTLPDFQIRYSWTPDTVVLWDNRFTMHYAVRDYSEPRRMIRTSTRGERPIGPKEYEAMREKVAA
jgi:taurine dioxygenase